MRSSVGCGLRKVADVHFQGKLLRGRRQVPEFHTDSKRFPVASVEAPWFRKEQRSFSFEQPRDGCLDLRSLLGPSSFCETLSTFGSWLALS